MLIGSMSPDESTSGPIEAVDRLVGSAQQLVVDHIQLASLEARETIRSTLAGSVLSLVGALLVIGSWGALLVWVYLLLANTLPPSTRVIGLGAVNLAVGALVLGAGLRLVRRPKEESAHELP